MGWIKKLLGAPESAGKVLDASIKGLDALVFTEEEKSVANGKMRDWYLDYLKATQPQNVSRRIIASIVAALWAFLVLLGVFVWPIYSPYSVAIFTVLKEVVAVPFGIVIGFYFAAHIVRAAK